MSTAAPASPPATSEPAPFDPMAFPSDLLDHQRQAAELYAELHAFQKTLPWSRVPHEGWPEETERGRETSGRDATDGWEPWQAAEYDRLFEALRSAAAAVQTHDWWDRCKQESADLVKIRQALKRAPGAAPHGQADAE
ncbi:hypothetical protein [Streptomyces pseudovenezuelae]|uniref:hypothetical protein n=1 Tax=Streptomyces pseudovenezuelae TaxID=67350 RepID=UPI0036E10FFF